MKLFFCERCHDVRRITSSNVTICNCGASGAWYAADAVTITLRGEAIPISLDSSDFWRAYYQRNVTGSRRKFLTHFDAFVYSDDCKTIKRVP